MTTSNVDCAFYGKYRDAVRVDALIGILKLYVDATTFKSVITEAQKMNDSQIVAWLGPIVKNYEKQLGVVKAKTITQLQQEKIVEATIKYEKQLMAASKKIQ